MYSHIPVGWSFPDLQWNFTFLSLSVPHLVAFLAVAYEFADILAHSWPKIFGCNAFVSA